MAAPAPIDLVFDVLLLAANSVLAKAVARTARPSGRVALMDEVIMQGWPCGAALCLDQGEPLGEPWRVNAPHFERAELAKLMRGRLHSAHGVEVKQHRLDTVNDPISFAHTIAGPFTRTERGMKGKPRGGTGSDREKTLDLPP